MPARHFTANTVDYLQFSLGGLGFAFGPGSMAAIIRLTSHTANRCIMGSGASLPNSTRFVVASAGPLNVATNNSGVNFTTTLSNNLWYCVGVSKATGSVAPRAHIYDYAANTWVHENAGSNVANSSVPVTRANIGVAADTTSFPFDGDIAMAGIWNVVLSDAQFELMPFDRLGWFNVQPKALWELDQAAVTMFVPDISGGGSNLTARNNTAVGTVSVPVFSREGFMAAA